MAGIVWQPSDSYIREANITAFMKKHGIGDYKELVKRSTDDIEWFWDAAVKDMGLEWYVPYCKLLDSSQGIPWTKWFIGGKINIVHNCLDRHIPARKDKTALISETEDGKVVRLTYGQLHEQVGRCANALKSLGVGKGDRVALYMPMVPEVVVAMLAVLKLGAIAVPIFSGFGPRPLAARLQDSGARILFTADGGLRKGGRVEIKRQADEVLAECPSVEHVVVLNRFDLDVQMKPGRDVWWHEFLEGQSSECPTEKTDSEDPCLIIYSSGTTGKPKGTVHVHGGALAQIAKEVRYHFDVKEDSVFFWLSDIGWMVGPHIVIGVMTFGGTVVIYEGVPLYPNAGRLWEMVEKHRITHFGISPTAVRTLIREGDGWVRMHDLSSLRIMGSTGEPWDPESWFWLFNNVGKGKVPIINWSGGTEIIGGFLLAMPIAPLKPCALVGPSLGMAVECFDDDGKPVRGRKGHLVCTKPAPSMTRGFWNDRQRYIETYWSRWPNVWYHGDWASVDEDGMWFLHGRSDDTIKVSGRRIGPAEIESVLIEHKAVSEAAAIGVPDKLSGERIVCFVTLKPGNSPSEELRKELVEHVTRALGKTMRPSELRFVAALPKTRSAKIVRRAIKAQYLGQELGDISTVENPDAIAAISSAI